jgi:hypothetical protein
MIYVVQTKVRRHFFLNFKIARLKATGFSALEDSATNTPSKWTAWLSFLL